MSIFESVKAAVSVKEAAERYGVKADKSGMTRCPFHEDHTPSLKLNRDYFYCFGCGATGDVIDFTSGLLGLGLYPAARQLAADFGIADGRPPPLAAELKRMKGVQTFRDKERLYISVLSGYLRILRDWKARYAPQNPNEPVSDRFAEACHQEGYVEYLLDCLLLSGPAECASVVEMLGKDNWFANLERRMKRLEMEERQHEQTRKRSVAI